jgi:PRTRC genetic system ThiF family protein
MLASGHPCGLDVTLIDGDRISRTNCVRQPFSESEIGLYKATVVATRINLFWGLGWKAIPDFMDERWGHETDILIGCVDTRAARNAITRSQSFGNCVYWLDLGNNADSGQFVLGQPENAKNKSRELRLATAAEMFPELVDPKLDRKDKLPSCSAVEALRRQEPLVNQTLAYLALAMLARLFRYGRISYHGSFVNLRTGRHRRSRWIKASGIDSQKSLSKCIRSSRVILKGDNSKNNFKDENRSHRDRFRYDQQLRRFREWLR